MAGSPLPSDWFVPLSVGVAALLALGILWKAPQWQVGRIKDLQPKERFDRENEARKTLATIIGGVVLILGFFGTWQNLRLAQDSIAISQQGQITDRFTKAIEELGATNADGKNKLEVRLGGIYALAGIASESQKNYWPIMEVLTTYVRENAPLRAQPAAEKTQVSTRPRADIQAILTVLGTRNRKFEPPDQNLDLSHTDIRGADLTQTDFSGANFIKADLSGSETHLDDANLKGTYFTDANLSLAHFSKADLTGAHLNGADLSGVYLRDAVGLTQQQINEAKGNDQTFLPKELRSPESWEKTATTTAH